MKRILLVGSMLLSVAASADFPADVRVAHPERYACGETATFEVTLRDPKTGAVPTNGTVTAVLSNYGMKIVSSNAYDLAKGPSFTVSGTLDEPGFLLLTLSGKDVRRNWGGGTHVVSVAYEPERVRTAVPQPDDFWAFWDGERAALERSVPLDPKLERIEKYSNGKRDLYRVSFATFNGRRVWGFLSEPKDLSKGPFPARVNVPGAGPGQYAQNMEGDNTSVVLVLNVHYFEPGIERGSNGEPCGKEAKAFAEAYGGPADSYASTGACHSRECQFYHDAVVGLSRAVDWLHARPEVDRTRFTYEGTSQGGGFGLILGGMTRRFTRLVAYVPALADQLGYKASRRGGWPRFYDASCFTADERAVGEKVMPYYDSAFFASRVECPVRFVVGLSDSVCPPATGTAAYNNCPAADKRLVLVPNMTHGVFNETYREFNAWSRGTAAK